MNRVRARLLVVASISLAVLAPLFIAVRALRTDDNASGTQGWVVFVLDASGNVDGTLRSLGSDIRVDERYRGFLDMALSVDGKQMMLVGRAESPGSVAGDYGITVYSVPGGAKRFVGSLATERTPSTIFSSNSLAVRDGSFYVEIGGGRLGAEMLVKYDTKQTAGLLTKDIAGCGPALLLESVSGSWPDVVCWGTGELLVGTRRIRLPDTAVTAMSSRDGADIYVFSRAGSVYHLSEPTAGVGLFALITELRLPSGWVVTDSRAVVTPADGTTFLGIASNEDASIGQFDEIWRIDPENGGATGAPIRSKGTSFTITPDGKSMLITNSYTGRVTIVDLLSGAESRVESSATSPVLAVGVKKP